MGFIHDEPKREIHSKAKHTVPALFRSAEYGSFSLWQQQLIKSVRRNRIVEVRLLIETGEHA